MTLQQLQYILALDNYRHFVTAAEKSFVSQPNLTMQVKKLEDEIGLQIFDRKKKPLEPTLAGAQIIEKIRMVLREVDQLKEFVSCEKDTITGEFKVGIIPTVAPYLLPRFLPNFSKNYPETKLVIKEMQTSEIIKNLNNSTLDIGILVTPLGEPSLREIHLYDEPFLFYVADKDPMLQYKKLSTDQVDTKKVLMLEEGHCFRSQALSICESERTGSGLSFEYQSGSIESLKGLVKKGVGNTFVPEFAVLDELDSDHVKRFMDPEPVREVSVVVHASFSKSRLVEILQNSIIESIPERFISSRLVKRVKFR
jgi:LysR family hydrogen peroxide-inducible transcriptional activator